MNCGFLGCDEDTFYDPETDDQRCKVHGATFGVVVDPSLVGDERIVQLRRQQAGMGLQHSIT